MQSRNRINIALLVLLLAGVVGLIVIEKKTQTGNNPNVSASETIKDSTFYSELYTEFFNFENIDLGITASKNAYTGTQSTMLTPKIEYGFGITKSIPQLSVLKNTEQVIVDFMCMSPIVDSSVHYVLSVSNAKNESVFWDGKPIKIEKANTWVKSQIKFSINPELLIPENTFQFYLWNREKKELYVDDLNFTLYGKVIYKEEKSTQISSNYFFDFETNGGLSGTDNLKACTSHSGKIASDLSEGQEFGVSVIKTVKEISDVPLTKISASVWFYPLEENTNTLLTASVVNDKNETVFWGGKGTDTGKFPKNQWTKLNVSFALPSDKISMNDVVQVNIWNKGKNKIIVDDLEIIYGDQPERKGTPNVIDPSAFTGSGFVPEKNKPPFQILYLNKQIVDIDVLKNYNSNDHFFSGDFIKDKNNLDELLCIKNNKAELIGFNTEKKQFMSVWKSSSESDLTSAEIGNSSNYIFTADFNGDDKTDLLTINKATGEAKLYNFETNKFILKNTLKGIDKKHLKYLNNMNVVSNFNINKLPALVYFTEKSMVSLQLKADKLEENQTGLVGDFIIFKTADKLFPLVSSSQKNILLRLNTEWRFDLQLIEKNSSEINIKNVVDFKGYANDYNPKYYEYTKIVTGRFMDKNNSSVLVVSCNCRDDKFDGVLCNEIENLKELPNSINIYSLDVK